jgi:hypothetical protein
MNGFMADAEPKFDLINQFYNPSSQFDNMYDNINLENVANVTNNRFSPKTGLFSHSGTNGFQNNPMSKSKKKRDTSNPLVTGVPAGTSSSIGSNKAPGSKVANKY